MLTHKGMEVFGIDPSYFNRAMEVLYDTIFIGIGIGECLTDRLDTSLGHEIGRKEALLDDVERDSSTMSFCFFAKFSFDDLKNLPDYYGYPTISESALFDKNGAMLFRSAHSWNHAKTVKKGDNIDIKMKVSIPNFT